MATEITKLGLDQDQEALEEELISFGLEQEAGDFLGFHAEIKGIQEEDDEWVIEGYASTKEVDREGEFIPPEAFDLSQYNGVLLYDHGKDPEVGRKPIGKVTHWIIDSKGLWVRAVISKAHEFSRKIWEMVKEGVLNSFSVGAPSRLVRKSGSKITYWPVAEISIVSVPAQSGATFTAAQAFKSLEELEQSPHGFLAPQPDAGRYGADQIDVGSNGGIRQGQGQRQRQRQRQRQESGAGARLEEILGKVAEELRALASELELEK